MFPAQAGMIHCNSMKIKRASHAPASAGGKFPAGAGVIRVASWMDSLVPALAGMWITQKAPRPWGLSLTLTPVTTCSIPGCLMPVQSRGWCEMHYARWRRHGDPQALLQPKVAPDPVCSIDGCGAPTKSRGWCEAHYQMWWKYGDPIAPAGSEVIDRSGECAVDGCGRPAEARGWCSRHYARWRAQGDPLLIVRGGVVRYDPAACVECGEPVQARGRCPEHYAAALTEVRGRGKPPWPDDPRT